MNSQARVLKTLIDDSMYVVDEGAVAEAIVARAIVRFAVAEFPFRNQQRGGEVRSFRRDRGARSFRLSRSASPWRTHQSTAASLDKRIGNRPRNIARM